LNYCILRGLIIFFATVLINTSFSMYLPFFLAVTVHFSETRRLPKNSTIVWQDLRWRWLHELPRYPLRISH